MTDGINDTLGTPVGTIEGTVLGLIDGAISHFWKTKLTLKEIVDPTTKVMTSSSV